MSAGGPAGEDCGTAFPQWLSTEFHWFSRLGAMPEVSQEFPFLTSDQLCAKAGFIRYILEPTRLTELIRRVEAELRRRRRPEAGRSA